MPENLDTDPKQSVTTRRAMLAGVGGAAALALCGCSSSASTQSSSAAAPAQGGSDGTSGQPTMDAGNPAGDGATGSASPAAGSASSGGGTVLGNASEVPVGGGMVFPTAKVVVTQPTAGQYKAFSAVCTHRACTVSSVAGGVIKCPCHGSTFKVEDGSVAKGPATSALPAVAVKVENGKLIASS